MQAINITKIHEAYEEAVKHAIDLLEEPDTSIDAITDAAKDLRKKGALYEHAFGKQKSTELYFHLIQRQTALITAGKKTARAAAQERLNP